MPDTTIADYGQGTIVHLHRYLSPLVGEAWRVVGWIGEGVRLEPVVWRDNQWVRDGWRAVMTIEKTRYAIARES